ncbi:protein Shroom2 isoform X2 [Narcine bancroftii]|uniref:protein Shroom2 isoform X2 n=1 Tax=Narcine bancroftii TaxID=1343680 RepID=UPI00383131DD
MGERRLAEGSRCVEVALSGGAPWGFTLRGGQEHGEPLLITKIEEGSKAAAVGKLQIGDELISINDVVLSGFRQEAICLVKGSYRTLKMVVRRRIEPVGRPHSWHSTKFSDSPQEPTAMQLSSSGICFSWHSSSSNNLAEPWEQTNLHRGSHQFSSLGSVDSLDQPPALYQPGHLSPAKYQNSTEHVAQASKRDSAYSSFSTNSSTPDYSLSSSRSNSSSTENVLSRVTYWEAACPGAARQGQAAPGPEGRECRPNPEERASPRLDEQPSSRPPRISLGPVWHVPEKRVPKMASPPPPLPPVRSDSYAATKVHGGGQPEGSGHPRQHGPGKPQLRGERELTEGPISSGGRRTCTSSPRPRDASSPALLDDPSRPRPSLPYHRRQCSDELASQQSDADFYPDPQLAAVEVTPRYDQSQGRAPPAHLDDVLAHDATGQNKYFCLTSRPLQQATAAMELSRIRVQSRNSQKAAAYPSAPALGPRPHKHYTEGGRSRVGLQEEMALEGQRGGISEPGACLPGPCLTGSRGLATGACWLGQEVGPINPEWTPFLHSLAQESRGLQAELGPAARQQRRSDRFATALRNEIQSKRAQLQKSRSAATLDGSPELAEDAGCPSSPSDGSFSSAYKDNLKEAQARVLGATSFQRRDLGLPAAPWPSRSSLAPEEGPSPPSTGEPRAPGRAAGHHPLSRVGGRKRLTQEQRLRSYSEPGKMNEVGGPDEDGRTLPPAPSFADRRQFFEAGIRAAYSRPAPVPRPQIALGEVSQWNVRASAAEAEEQHREPEEWDRAASLGVDGWQDGPDQAGNWSQGSTFPVRMKPEGERGIGGRELEPQRLGTFAEYQATWRQQRKLSEARSSGRYHSADNILDQSLQQPIMPQYVHERSRSSPSTDFYTQDIPIEVRRRPEGFQREMAQLAANAGANVPRRHLGTGSLENNSEGRPFQLEQTKTERNAWTSEHLPEERHGHPFSMLSEYHYPEVQAAKKVGADSLEPCPRGWELNQNQAVSKGPEDSAATGKKQRMQAKADERWQQELSHSGGTTPPRMVPTEKSPELTKQSELQEAQHSRLSGEGAAHPGHVDSGEHSTFHSPKSPTDVPRSPSPQFAPQRLTDKPPLTLEEDSMARIEKVTENNTTVKKVPIKIVRSESQTEKENRHHLLNKVDLVGVSDQEQPKSIGSHEHPYSPFAAYSRQEREGLTHQTVVAQAEPRASEESSLTSDCSKAEKSTEDIKSEELVREIVVKDRSLADILYPNSKMKTTMDLMEGIFPKDENFKEEAQQRRKLLPRSQAPKAMEEREDDTIAIGVPLTTSSTYYSTSAPKAELLNKLKDMQQQMEEEEDSEDELNNDLTEKKQELIDSISKKLQVLREARESLQEDIQANNLLGDEVEDTVKKVCKPNELDKFRMFIGDLDKVVNLLLSLSGRLARVENALNTLEESASPEERRTLTQKQKLLTRQHEDAKELKEHLDRRERLVFDILSGYLTDELLQDYEHFVKMKSALTIEQRELEDKIKLGEEQLKCLLESLPLDCKPK